jgi:hypothetical protein
LDSNIIPERGFVAGAWPERDRFDVDLGFLYLSPVSSKRPLLVTNMAAINLSEKFGQIDELWRPKVVAALNGQEVKLVKFKGVFPWHFHAAEDELLMVWKG